jgi:hypothetical protein
MMMPTYEVEFEAKYPEWGSVQLEANSIEDAEQKAELEIKTLYDDYTDIRIDTIREIGNDGK